MSMSPLSKSLSHPAPMAATNTNTSNWYKAAYDNKPWMIAIALLVVTFGMVVMRRFKARPTLTLNQQLQQLLKMSPRNVIQVRQKNREFVDALFKEWNLPAECNNAENKEQLTKKLEAIFLDHVHQSDELKREICDNVIHNFKKYLIETRSRISKDMLRDQKFIHMFGIQQGDRISKIELIGDETHNKGKKPALVVITLQNDKKIVYKPRSMFNEKKIVGQGDSLFAAMGLPTYRVHDKKQYGYSEYLQNLEAENTFDSRFEVARYMETFDIMEEVMQILGISDLHCENVITSRKRPYLIDLEAVHPHTKAFETGLVTRNSAGCLFTADFDNQIWFDPNSDEQEIRDAHRSIARAYEGVGKYYSELAAHDALSCLGLVDSMDQRRNPKAKWRKRCGTNPDISSHNPQIQELKRLLDQRQHRMALVNSTELARIIKMDPEAAAREFLAKVVAGCSEWGVKMQGNDTLILNLLMTDIKNNDLPVFYYHPSRNEIYYHDRLIAWKV